MSKFTALTDELHDYIVAAGSREDEVLARVREETAAMGSIAVMQIAPDQGAFMTMLARITGASRAIEVGTFTGYSAICVARGLPEDGMLTCCELSEEYAAIAARNFEAAGVVDKVTLRIGPASESLDSLGPEASFDLAFIDADKTGYRDYFERCLQLLRPGGLIVLDNVLQDGKVLAPDGPQSEAIRKLNAELADDERIDLSMVAVADGLTLARKR